MKSKENMRFSRSFSYAPRTFRVCFGSDLRLSCTYVGFILRFVIIVYYHKYTKVVFNLLHTFIFIILIHVLSVVQAVPCAFCVADSTRRTSAVADHSVIARSLRPLWRIALLLFLLSTINYKLSTNQVCTSSSAGGS